ncbi:alpha/beta fold hydrolase [Enterococcus faecalis]|nr:alpha/beta fold hydrolase [Enterococcus faecalis]ELT8947898.1 alpha/beta fold hydrolase [Enterococcus faecalis]
MDQTAKKRLKKMIARKKMIIGKKVRDLLIFVVSVCLSIILGVSVFTLLVIKMQVLVALAASIISFFLFMLGLNRLRLRIFNSDSSIINIGIIVPTIFFGALMFYVFATPTKTYESTHSEVKQYGVAPDLIETSMGEKVAVYVQKPKTESNSESILFVNGGPGLAPNHSVKEFLDGYTDLGYTVYAFDPIGVRESPIPKNVDSYSMENEVRVIDDIVSHYNINKVNLVAHSFGGNVATRFIEKNPEKVNAYLALDTAPIYSMNENYPGQQQDKEFGQTVEPKRIEEKKDNGNVKVNPSLKQIVKWGFANELREIFNLKDIPYGSYDEYDYYSNLLLSSVWGGVSKDGKLDFRMNTLSNDLLTKDLEKTPDFTKNLKKESTPPTLVAHPEFGVVPWQIHYQYKEYFKNTQFLLIDGVGHNVWDTETSRKLLIENGDALFQHEPLTDDYAKSDNPYPV